MTLGSEVSTSGFDSLPSERSLAQQFKTLVLISGHFQKLSSMDIKLIPELNDVIFSYQAAAVRTGGKRVEI